MLVGYVSLQICALLAPCRRPILIATKDMLFRGQGTRHREALWGFLFILPTYLGFAIFILGPVVAVAGMSFTKFDVLGGSVFTGLANYSRMLSDDRLRTVYANTFLFTSRGLSGLYHLPQRFGKLPSRMGLKGLIETEFFHRIVFPITHPELSIVRNAVAAISASPSSRPWNYSRRSANSEQHT